MCPVRGVPHGWGMWCDDHPQGERLQGWWENGVPVGPFHSSTVDKGWAFSCVQLAVCSNAAQPWDAKQWWPDRAPALSWGVVSAEVSVAGHFFRHLPRSRLVLPLSPTTTPREAVGALAHADGRSTAIDSLTVSINQADLHVSGHTRAPEPGGRCAGAAPPAVRGQAIRRRGGAMELGGCSVTDSISVDLSVDAWGQGALHVPGFEQIDEVMVWVSGFNTTVEEVSRAVGQLLGLAAFPPRIKPVLFSWPGGSELTYLQALRLCAAPETGADFVAFFEGLLDSARIRCGDRLVHSVDPPPGIPPAARQRSHGWSLLHPLLPVQTSPADPLPPSLPYPPNLPVPPPPFPRTPPR